MSKTFIYCIAVIAVFLLVVKPISWFNNQNETADTDSDSNMTGAGVEASETQNSGTGLSENKDENGVSQGAAGQQKYRIGYRGYSN